MWSEMFSDGERVDTGDGNVGNRFERVLSAMPDFLTVGKELSSVGVDGGERFAGRDANCSVE